MVTCNTANNTRSSLFGKQHACARSCIMCHIFTLLYVYVCVNNSVDELRSPCMYASPPSARPHPVTLIWILQHHVPCVWRIRVEVVAATLVTNIVWVTLLISYCINISITINPWLSGHTNKHRHNKCIYIYREREIHNTYFSQIYASISIHTLNYV